MASQDDILLTNVGQTNQGYRETRMIDEPTAEGGYAEANYSGGRLVSQEMNPAGTIPVPGGYASPPGDEMGMSRQERFDRAVMNIGFNPMTYDPVGEAQSMLDAEYTARFGSGYMTIPEYRKGFMEALDYYTKLNSAKQQAGLRALNNELDIWSKDKEALLPSFGTLKEGDVLYNKRTGRQVMNAPKYQTVGEGGAAIVNGQIASRNPKAEKLAPGEMLVGGGGGGEPQFNFAALGYGGRGGGGGVIMNPNETATQTAARTELTKEFIKKRDEADERASSNLWGQFVKSEEGRPVKYSEFSQKLPADQRENFLMYNQTFDELRSANPYVDAQTIANAAMTETNRRYINRKYSNLPPEKVTASLAKEPQHVRDIAEAMGIGRQAREVVAAKKAAEKKKGTMISTPTFINPETDWAF